MTEPEMRVARKVKELSDENAELRKEVADLKERWRKTHEPSELRVQLARALEEIHYLQRQLNNANRGEEYSKFLSQKLTCGSDEETKYS